MATYTFTLRPGVTLSDAKVQYGGGTYDIDDGLTAGSGTITTTDDNLAAALRTAMTTVAGSTVTLLIEGGVTPGAAPPDLRANVPVFVQGAQPTQKPYWWVKTDGSGNPTGVIEFHDGTSAHVVGNSDASAALALAAATAIPTASSPVATRTIWKQQYWLGWLASQGVKGIITETGHPANRSSGDTYQWNRVAEAYFNALASEDVPVSTWNDLGTFAFLTGASAAGGAYNAINRGAAPLIRHVADGAPRGFQMGGVVGVSPPGGYSNTNNGTGSNWLPDVASYAFLAKLGVGLVRISHRWENLQPALNGALHQPTVDLLKTHIAAANAAGIKVILDPCHNYCSYITSGGTLHIGDGTLTQAHLVDFWTKMSTAFKGLAGIYGYELMNEPASMVAAFSTTINGAQTLTIGGNLTVGSTTGAPTGRNFGCLIGSTLVVLKVVDGTTVQVIDAAGSIGVTNGLTNGMAVKSPQALWETVSQAVVTAIRGNSDTTLLLVPGYDYQSADRWRFNHPVAWITDPASAIRYAAHHYFSADPTGDSIYGLTWAQEEAACTFAGPSSFYNSKVGYPPFSAVLKGMSDLPIEGEWTARGPKGAAPGSMTSGRTNMTFFYGSRAEVVAKLRHKIITAPTATPTQFKVDVCEVRPTGELFQIGSAIITDTTFGEHSEVLDRLFYKRPYLLYTARVLCVQGSGTLPALAGIPPTTPGNSAGGNVFPPVAMYVGDTQTDLGPYQSPNAMASSNAVVYEHGLVLA